MYVVIPANARSYRTATAARPIPTGTSSATGPARPRARTSAGHNGAEVIRASRIASGAAATSDRWVTTRITPLAINVATTMTATKTTRETPGASHEDGSAALGSN